MKCDESVTSQTTICSVWQNLNASSVDGAQYRAKRLRLHFEKSLSYQKWPTLSPFRCTNRRQILTFASGMQASCPPWAHAALTLRPAYGVLTFSHAAIHATNKALFVTSSFRLHNIILYWNWCKVKLLFQLISVLLISMTFYTYLANIIFFVRLGL